MDMLEPTEVIAGVEATLAHFGRIDALINNAVYRGPGAYDPLVGTPIDCFSHAMQANFLCQALLTQQVLAPDVERWARHDRQYEFDCRCLRPARSYGKWWMGIRLRHVESRL